MNQLADFGMDFGVIYLRAGSEAHGWGELDVRHPSYVSTRQMWDAARLLFRFVTQGSPKILAVFGYRGPLRIALLAFARMSGAHVVTRSDSNAAALLRQPQWKLRLRRVALRMAFPETTRVWAIGQSNAAFWRDYVGRSNLELIPYTTPVLPSSTGTPPTMRRSDPERLRFVFVGRLIQLKNVDLLVKAFMTLASAEYAQWKLTIVGAGPLRAELESLARPDPRITFVGAIEYDELDAVYLNSDVLVLPSSQEPWGLVVNEALGFGLRAIVSDQVGAAELLTSGGVGGVFPAGSVEQLASEMRASVNFLDRRPSRQANPAKHMEMDLRRLLNGEG
jgi:glycosyltransferase involved in cell wall biosynthesis